jgi:hypothetical protein
MEARHELGGYVVNVSILVQFSEGRCFVNNSSKERYAFLEDSRNKIKAARNDPDLAEAVLSYFQTALKIPSLKASELKSRFIAFNIVRGGKESKRFPNIASEKELFEEVSYLADIVPNGIEDILRTYGRATPALQLAQRERGLSREAAGIISRLSGHNAWLQEKVVDVFFGQELELGELRKLVGKLMHAPKTEQTRILSEYQQVPTVVSEVTGLDLPVALLPRLANQLAGVEPAQLDDQALIALMKSSKEVKKELDRIMELGFKEITARFGPGK